MSWLGAARFRLSSPRFLHWLKNEQDKLMILKQKRESEGELAGLISVFRKWLYLPDPSPLYTVLGAYAGNKLDGVPVWVLLVGQPSCGGTTMVDALGDLPHTYMLSNATKAAMLSATPAKDKTKGATGGVLREVERDGGWGMLLWPDFTSVLKMPAEARDELLDVIRQVFDRRYSRPVGTDGARRLEWAGKVGLIGKCTPAIDQHYHVINEMGPRCLFYRYRELAHNEALAKGGRAIGNMGNSRMQQELRDEVGLYMEGVRVRARELNHPDQRRVIATSWLASKGRSVVVRDSYTREVIDVPESEDLSRMSQQLVGLYLGLKAVGVVNSMAWEIVVKVGLDSIPALRAQAMRVLVRDWRKGGKGLTMGEVCRAGLLEGEKGLVHVSDRTLERVLVDMEVHGLFRREKGRGRGGLGGLGGGKEVRWMLSEEAKEEWEIIGWV